MIVRLASLAAAILLLISTAASQNAEDAALTAVSAAPVDVPTVAAIYLARDDGTGHAGDPATVFRPRDVPIYCVVQLKSAGPFDVRMDLLAVAVAGVKPGTRVVSARYTTRGREDRVNFTGSPQGVWVAGRYRADVFVNGKPAGRLEFEVIAGEEAIRPTRKQPAVKRTKARL